MLPKFIRYYLDCLKSEARSGVAASVGSRGHFYVELNSLPTDGGDFSKSDQDLLKEIKADRGEIYFGYPIKLRKRKDGALYAEPIFLYSVDRKRGFQNQPEISRHQFF